METKQSIRKEVFRRRELASRDQIRRNSHAIFKRLCALPVFREASWIYLYIDCRNEVMTEEIMEEALRQGKRVAAPKVCGKDMVFYEITSREDLEPGYFKIQEPREGQKPADDETALIVMPGVAFDPQRRRVGYGGGFYDRYLNSHRNHATAAVAFDFQMFEQVPWEDTDILPDILITETRCYQ